MMRWRLTTLDESPVTRLKPVALVRGSRCMTPCRICRNGRTCATFRLPTPVMQSAVAESFRCCAELQTAYSEAGDEREAQTNYRR
jgi:hypothetical protein